MEPTVCHARWLKPAEVSGLFVEVGLFPVPPQTLRDWADAGRISTTRTAGGHRRFRESDVKALIGALLTESLNTARTEQAVA